MERQIKDGFIVSRKPANLIQLWMDLMAFTREQDPGFWIELHNQFSELDPLIVEAEVQGTGVLALHPPATWGRIESPMTMLGRAVLHVVKRIDDVWALPCNLFFGFQDGDWMFFEQDYYRVCVDCGAIYHIGGKDGLRPHYQDMWGPSLSWVTCKGVCAPATRLREKDE